MSRFFAVFSLGALFISVICQAQAEESEVDFRFTDEASKVFAEALLLSAESLPEVSIQGDYQRGILLSQASCLAHVLRPNWDSNIAKSISDKSHITCTVVQFEKQSTLKVDLSKIEVAPFGNRFQHHKAFMVSGEFSLRLMKSLLKAQKALPPAKIFKTSQGLFSTNADALIDVTILTGENLTKATIDCFSFINLNKEGVWEQGVHACSFVPENE
jgi:hypothetical protein